MELRDREICYRALQSRDARFNGLIFVAVTSAQHLWTDDATAISITRRVHE